MVENIIVLRQNVNMTTYKHDVLRYYVKEYRCFAVDHN